jgi:hypothetical protein
VDESAGAFTDPAGEQAFAFRYTNSGVTTAQGVIGALTAGATYTVSFDVVADSGATPYSAALVTFNGAARNDVRANTGATSTLASKTGSASGASYVTVTFSYTADGSEATLGHDLALRFFGASTSCNIDNVQVSTSGGSTGDTFADWIADYPGVGGLSGFDDDPDLDGNGNGLENYFGTDPSGFSAGLVAGTKSGSTFTFSHPLNATPASDISAAYRWSKDLATFHADGATDGGGTTVTFAPGVPAGGTVTVTATITGTPADKLFVDLKVTRQ